MKKLLSLILLFTACALSAQQISKNALGVRIGSHDGVSIEVSYQKATGFSNRFEFNAGFSDNNRADTFKVTGLYEWVWNLDEGFNWYAGAGAGLGLWDANNTLILEDGFFINGTGIIGIEYDFPTPLLLSLDLRPEIRLIGDYGEDVIETSLGISARYQF